MYDCDRGRDGGVSIGGGGAMPLLFAMSANNALSRWCKFRFILPVPDRGCLAEAAVCLVLS